MWLCSRLTPFIYAHALPLTQPCMYKATSDRAELATCRPHIVSATIVIAESEICALLIARGAYHTRLAIAVSVMYEQHLVLNCAIAASMFVPSVVVGETFWNTQKFFTLYTVHSGWGIL